MASDPFLLCRVLTCGYHGRAVIHNISFSATRGESIALLGANGSGKSTLIRALCLLMKPLSGDVEIDGRNLSSYSVSDLARQVAVVPQEEPTPFPFRVREVVTLGRLAYGNGIFDTAADIAAAEEAMRTAECLELADRPITELSGGEKQRVLLARAIAQDAPLMLLDEPTAHLDPPHQVAVAALSRKLAAKGRTLLAAVHDLNLASLMADRAILIGEGRIVKDGPVEEVLYSSELEDCYKTRFERVRTESGRLLVVPIPVGV